MEQEIMELVCLMDRSVSMYGREEKVLEQYYELLGDYGKSRKDCYVTAGLFSDEVEMLCVHRELPYVKPLRRGEFYVDGSTALFDSVKQMFGQMEHCFGMQREEIPRQVHVYVITDGIDNGSIETGKDEFRRLMREKSAQGWRIRLATPGGNPVRI